MVQTLEPMGLIVDAVAKNETASLGAFYNAAQPAVVAEHSY